MRSEFIAVLARKRNYRNILLILAIWLPVAAWHPFYLGLFTDDWALYILRASDISILESIKQHPNIPQSLIYSGIDLSITVNRPVYAFLLFSLKLALGDSAFAWQTASALILLAAAYSVFYLTTELLKQLGYKDSDSQFGAILAVLLYMLGPWSVVMGIWPTVAITLISQIFVMVGLTWLICSRTQNFIGAAILILVGFLIYEAYWLIFVPVTIFMCAVNRWKLNEYIRFIGIVFGILILALLIKAGLSNIWGMPSKTLNYNFIPLFFQNLIAYPRVLSDALKPIPLKYFFGAVITMVIYSHILGGRNRRRFFIYFLALCAGLASSALLYAVAGYGLAGVGIMSRTLAAQNIYFSLFIAITMMPVITMIQSIQGCDIRAKLSQFYKNTVFLVMCITFIFLVSILSISTILRSHEWTLLWNAEVSVLKQFPYQQLMDDMDHIKERTTVIIQIDEDVRGEIFGAPWDVGPALVWMYPGLRGLVESQKLTFLVGREAEWATVWDGKKIIQKWCNNSTVVTSVDAVKVLYIGLSLNGATRYHDHDANHVTGCR
jgi:hypothetical protein